MGQRNAAETLVLIVGCFLDKRTWSQADLARTANVRVDTIRKHLLELQEVIPLTRDEDHPNVYWSLPKDWLPGGLSFSQNELHALLRMLMRAPKTKDRERLVNKVAEALRLPRTILDSKAIASVDRSPESEHCLITLEQAALHQRALRFQYFSVSRGVLEFRNVSVQRVFAGPPIRFIATCHKDDKLKWFRGDRVTIPTFADDAAFRHHDGDKLQKFVDTSVKGYRGEEAITESVFFVKHPEAQWVKANLIAPMTFDEMREGIRVRAKTAAVQRIARFVVSLGDVAQAETPELQVHVRRLAEGALRVTELPRAKPLRAT